MTALIHGVVLSIGLILPLGAQNMFVFNQGAVQKPFLKAFPAVITAALCDTVLIMLAITGISALVVHVKDIWAMVLFAGIIFLFYMGWTVWKSNGNMNSSEKTQMSAKKQVVFAMSVSLLNPHAIIDTIGVIGTNSIAYTGTGKWIFAAACVSVSWIWFIVLAVLGRIIGQLDNNGKIQLVINKFSAIIIWFVAIYLSISLIQRF